MRTAYDVLGITRDTPLEEAEQSYRDQRQQAEQTPTIDPQAAAQRDQRLTELEWAWRTLSDPTARRAHDDWMAAGGGTQGAAPAPGWGPPAAGQWDTPYAPPLPTSRRERQNVPTIVVVMVVCIFLLMMGRIAWRATDTVEREDGRIAEREHIGPEHLRVGDCFNAPSGDEGESVDVDQVEVIPCDQPHENEVFEILELEAAEGEDYPGSDQIAQRALQACVPGFEAFIGITVERTPSSSRQ